MSAAAPKLEEHRPPGPGAEGAAASGRALSDQTVAYLLFSFAFVALMATEKAVGFTRDESVYFAAAESYARWFRMFFASPSAALSDGAITSAFGFNSEHPVLMKSLYGLSHLVFHEWLGLLRPATAFRLPAFLVAALIAPLLYLLGTELYGRKAGLFAAASFFLVPRQFFNAQLSCFDIPVTAFWLLTIYAFWRAQSRPRWWMWTGVAFGLTIATKHNGFFIPFVLGPFALYLGFRRTQAGTEARTLLLQLAGAYAAAALLYALLYVALGPTQFFAKLLLLSPHTAIFLGLVGVSAYLSWRLRQVSDGAFRAVAPIVAMTALGPVVLYLHWPYLWHHPVDRVVAWLGYHSRHEHYAWFYLGSLLRTPPFPLEYVLVKTALTVPTSLFVPMVLGFSAVVGRALLSLSSTARAWVKAPSWEEALVAVNAAVSIAIISHPQVPHFGGVKHWFPSMTFLSVLAGASVARGASAGWQFARRFRPNVSEWVVAGPLMALLVLPALVSLVRVHPYGTAAYSELAGGVPGAATLGMQRQFWSSHVTAVLEWLNQNAPVGARVYFHEVTGFAVRDYQRNGMLRPDIVAVGGPQEADIVAYQYHQEFREHELNVWQAFGTQKPVTGLYLDETPQIVVYRRR